MGAVIVFFGGKIEIIGIPSQEISVVQKPFVEIGEVDDFFPNDGILCTNNAAPQKKGEHNRNKYIFSPVFLHNR